MPYLFLKSPLADIKYRISCLCLKIILNQNPRLLVPYVITTHELSAEVIAANGSGCATYPRIVYLAKQVCVNLTNEAQVAHAY